MEMTNDQLRDLSNALIRLTGVNKMKASANAGLNTANISEWLAGKDKKCSLESKLVLLNSLGVKYGMLRRDMTHHWVVNNDPADIVMALSMTCGKEYAKRVEIEESIDPEQPCSIKIPSTNLVNPNPQDVSVRIHVTRPLMTAPPVAISSMIASSDCKETRSLGMHQ